MTKMAPSESRSASVRIQARAARLISLTYGMGTRIWRAASRSAPAAGRSLQPSRPCVRPTPRSITPSARQAPALALAQLGAGLEDEVFASGFAEQGLGERAAAGSYFKHRTTDLS